MIPIELQRLFTRLLLLQSQAVATTDLTRSFGWAENEFMYQQDVQELNRWEYMPASVCLLNKKIKKNWAKKKEKVCSQKKVLGQKN